MDIAEVEREIRKYEAERTTWGNCERLAVLYTVQDHFADDNKKVRMPEYSYAPPTDTGLEQYGESEFLTAIVGRDAKKVWAVVDELVESEMVMNPKIYTSFMRKIYEI